MTNRFLFRLLPVLAIVGNLSCSPDRLRPPEPAQSIVGTYEAQNNQLRFPLSGPTLQLTVRRVTTDSVAVTVYAPSQPADSIRFERAYVGQEFSQTSSQDGCIGYRVYLAGRNQLDQLSMTCAEPNVFYFAYQIPGATAYTTLKFRKL